MATAGMSDDGGDEDDEDGGDGDVNHQRRVLNDLKRKGAKKCRSVR